MHFDLADLRLMVRIAEANSLTRGAEAAFLSLPAASTRIKNLEEKIGAKLLYRTSQGVTLTPPGQAFVHHARTVLAQLEHLAGDMQEYAHGVKGHLRIASTTTALSEYLPPVLRLFLQAHPDVDVDLHERPSQEIVRAVCESQTDIGLVAGPVRTESLQAIPYRSDRLVLVVSKEHALAAETRVPFRSTLDCNHVGLHKSSAIHAFLRQVSTQLNRTLRMRIEVSNFETVCRMIDANVGVGVVPLSSAKRHAANLAVQIVDLEDEWALRQQYILVRDLEGLPSFGRDLVELLIADARDASGDATR
ncbi:MAG: LysR family transcriptional regulator [Mitsuaria chitosanitabida]|jgi:DNA-binding transcriptional LysR family regulator|uniref:LysR family transcriptional regulator n=1 Tax=Roseateles chitosanitabidus TaxID=65048 RepID=UPI001B15FF7C|nr:LysR substrate-binding domain-containing protein [Roseateles chitosanitabidus]MBO9687627.1 LysR family transcriptional regulator [Roseateles chitosanitabidus]